MTRDEKIRKDIIMNDDGYYVYWPESTFQGYLSEGDLLEIYNIIHEMNKPWDEIIRNDPAIN